MKTCTSCNNEMETLETKTPEGVLYQYYKCKKCGDEIVNMAQLHEVAKKYRQMRKYHAKLTKWGFSLGVRIPKDLVKKYKLKDNGEVIILPEEEGMRIMTV